MANGSWTESGPRPLWQRGVDFLIPTGTTRDFRSLFGSNRTLPERAIAAAKIVSSASGAGGVLAKLGIKLADKYVKALPSTIWRQLSADDRNILKEQGVTDEASLKEYLDRYNNDSPGNVERNSAGLGLNMPGSPFGFTMPIINKPSTPNYNPTISVGDIIQGDMIPSTQIPAPNFSNSNPYTYVGDEVNSGPPAPGPTPITNHNSGYTPGVRFNSGFSNFGGTIGGGGAANAANVGNWQSYSGMGSMNPSGGQNLDPRYLPG